MSGEDGKNGSQAFEPRPAGPPTEKSLPTESLPTESLPTESLPTESLPTESLLTPNAPTSTRPALEAVEPTNRALLPDRVPLLDRPWWQAIGSIASCIGLGVSIVLVVVVHALDNDRSRQDAKAAREFEWRRTLLPYSAFPGADLHGLDLTAVYAGESDLSSADVRGTDFSRSYLIGAHLEAVDAEGALFDGALMDRASFRGANLAGTTFTDSSLEFVDFRNTIVKGATFAGADLWRTDLRGVDLSGATFGDAVDLSHTCWDEKTVWPSDFAEPATSLCVDSDDGNSSPSLSDSWSTEMLVAPKTDKAPQWSKTAEIVPGQAVQLLFRIRNLGRAPLGQVALVVELGRDAESGSQLTVAEPGSIVLHKGPYVETLSDAAIQDAGRQLNINVGDFVARDDAYIVATVRINEANPIFRCGYQQVNIIGYATPENRGASSDGASINIMMPQACE